MSYTLTPSYGKQAVPVFKITKDGPKHSIVDMEVQIMLSGAVDESWLSGENHQILPTETQKNTCYALALKTEFTAIEDYGIALASDILKRHGHFTQVELQITERVWDRIVVGGVQHNHAFRSTPSPVRRFCKLVVTRDTMAVTSGVSGIKLMKTTQGFIQDEFTNLVPVGEGTANPDRIMCTEMEAEWSFSSGPPTAAGPDYRAVNAAVLQLLLEKFAGPPELGRFSKSLQETVYIMATAVLDAEQGIDCIDLTTPNIHFYAWAAEQFGLSNPNYVFQSTDCRTSASGRISTKLARSTAGAGAVRKAKL